MSGSAVAAPEDPAFYATVAQVIPTLLLAAAVEYRLMGPEQRNPSADEVRSGFWLHLWLALFIPVAFAGEVAALQAMYVGGGSATATLSLLGALAALLLVLQPLLMRVTSAPLTPWPWFRRYYLHNVIPAALFGTGAGAILYDLWRG